MGEKTAQKGIQISLHESRQSAPPNLRTFQFVFVYDIAFGRVSTGITGVCVDSMHHAPGFGLPPLYLITAPPHIYIYIWLHINIIGWLSVLQALCD